MSWTARSSAQGSVRTWPSPSQDPRVHWHHSAARPGSACSLSLSPSRPRPVPVPSPPSLDSRVLNRSCLFGCRTGDKCVLHFKPCGLFGKELHRVEGHIQDKK